MNRPQRNLQPSKTQVRLYLDLVLFVLFLVTNAPQGTGILFHEWIGIAFIIPIVVHVVMDWQWLVSVTQRLFRKLNGETRFNHFWDILLFIMMTLVTFSGVIVSHSALPSLGIPIQVDHAWVELHEATANLLIIMVGIHLAMHLKWIVSTMKRYLFQTNTRTVVVEAQR